MTELVIDVVINCPKCGAQHIDAPDPKHVLYKQGDADVPDVITDGMGGVVLCMCRRCGRAESELDEPCWTNPPHKSHLCHSCGLIWRVADIATNGVQCVRTRGSRDTWPVSGTKQ